MVWGYLSEFWDSITETVVGGITYTAVWFENIGNAVAGAIGGFFDDLIHHIYDLFYLVLWFFDNLQEMFSIAFTPLLWIFNFAKGFLSSATSSIEELGLEVNSFDLYTTDVNNFISAIPHFSLFVSGIGALLGIFFVIYIVKRASNI